MVPFLLFHLSIPILPQFSYLICGLTIALDSWTRVWQPTPVFSPGEFHGQRSLAGYSPWGCNESDMTEAAWHARNSTRLRDHLVSSQVALVVKNMPANAGDTRNAGLIPGWGRSPGEGHGKPLQYSYLENPMD